MVSTKEIAANNKKIVLKVMLNYDCQTATSIAMDALRLFRYEISPASVSGVLRPMIKRGLVGSSRDGFGKTHYWLCDDFKAALMDHIDELN